MQRLTGNQAYDLMEAYNSIYESEQLTEEQIVESFNIWIEDLLNEGYDLSEYTYDDLYEYYLNEGPIPWKAVGNFVWRQGIKPFFTGAGKKEPGVTYGAGRSINKLQGLAGRVLAPLGIVQVAGPPVGSYLKDRDKEYTGGAITKILGHGHNALKSLGSMIPEPGSSGDDKPRQSGSQGRGSRPAPPKDKYTYDPFSPLPENYTDFFDIVHDYLLREGYADTEEDALAIMSSMSEEWKAEIISELLY